jgi:hypothetical protein
MMRVMVRGEDPEVRHDVHFEAWRKVRVVRPPAA